MSSVPENVVMDLNSVYISNRLIKRLKGVPIDTSKHVYVGICMVKITWFIIVLVDYDV